MFKRSSGVLAHVTSLPSPHGVGTMGKTARDFVDFLAAAHQTYWQGLPLGHTGCSFPFILQAVLDHARKML